MARPICCTCHVEMKLETAGIVVVETANKIPYQLWRADRWECSSCQHRIVSGFAQHAYAFNGSPDWAEQVLLIPADAEWNYERLSDAKEASHV